tara:strand:- start:3183 stop:3656 length:474 start_codon:yes stop_codon:yes gene_type:complete
MSVFLEKKYNKNEYKIAIVVAKFNHIITEQLRFGAMDAFFNYGGKEKNLDFYYVPGAFEVAGTIKQILDNLEYDAILTVGAVIKGETPHFNFIASESANKISTLSIQAKIPILFGILTTDTLQQALERSGTKALNKGWELMEATLATINTYSSINSK